MFSLFHYGTVGFLRIGDRVRVYSLMNVHENDFGEIEHANAIKTNFGVGAYAITSLKLSSKTAVLGKYNSYGYPAIIRWWNPIKYIEVLLKIARLNTT